MSRKVAAAFDELLEAGSVEAVRAVVARHPELLEDEAIQILARTAEQADESVRPLVDGLLELLMEWRSFGLDADVEGVGGLRQQDDLTEALASLVTSGDTAAQLRAVVAESPELLGDEAERRLLEMEADSSAYTADRFLALVTFLRACRCGDVDAACAAYDRDLAEVDAAGRLASEYVFMTDEPAQDEFLRAHPVLLGRQAEAAIAQLCDTLGQDPAIAATLGMRGKLDTVRRLREAARAT